MWFDDYAFMNGKSYLVKYGDDGETLEYYPITQDGIDEKNVELYENIRYGKRKNLWY